MLDYLGKNAASISATKYYKLINKLGKFTQEELKQILIKHPYALYRIPYKLRNKELCEVAVINYGGALEFVPKKNRTKKLCKIAVMDRGHALACVPKHLMTEELCEFAITNNSFAIAHIPSYLRTEKIKKLYTSLYGNAPLHRDEW